MADEDDIPRVEMSDAMRADIEKNPELAKAMRAFSEAALNAMQGVQDGRYANFEDAMEALCGQRPTKLEPRYPKKYGYYLSLTIDPRGDGYMASITDGHPAHGHKDITFLTLGRFKSEEEARSWFELQCAMEPWADGDLMTAEEVKKQLMGE